MSLTILKTVSDLRSYIKNCRDKGEQIGLVPTMGALHAGHMALVEDAKSRAACVIVTIFVNPKQFGPNEDLDSYPRQLEVDCALAEKHGATAIFAPSVDEMYPQGFATNISVSGVSEGLCGGARPGHFDGVATVVTKLLLQALPDFACFGQKDYQQLQVINRFVTDLDIPVNIIDVPIVRDEEGLALSSRNAYLNDEEIKTARQMNKILRTMAQTLEEGKTDISGAIASGRQALLDAGFKKVDYLAIRDAKTLEPLETINREGRILAAAFCGPARLIDNMAVKKQ